ncbi:hypothetical protein NOR51B_2821 [Luminiphilus syltensis NOR5-1B]|uniref:Uncharacterized protein n=1 Tax=Luminiphilus syltensis NOR5-1B TaxID=565045 RepID=B8KRJ4_9GAMM|nr:hypothetical protein [Luminiphilus syltensis]EED36732.1 hypothetical protein NOR51B_2684 [Luminiphilus syltensis NOR5-1B]EED36868.1 hypothetical protein NOR51B_2821 [Luminiphilus syltensis NOR5-1B]
MDTLDERFSIYTAVVFICSTLGALAGLSAAAVTFGVLAVGIELAYVASGLMNATDQSDA